MSSDVVHQGMQTTSTPAPLTLANSRIGLREGFEADEF
jgi:hypothetical protein